MRNSRYQLPFLTVGASPKGVNPITTRTCGRTTDFPGVQRERRDYSTSPSCGTRLDGAVVDRSAAERGLESHDGLEDGGDHGLGAAAVDAGDLAQQHGHGDGVLTRTVRDSAAGLDALVAGRPGGLVPITGIPLPFFSYGGSFFIICSLCLGLAFRVAWDSRQSGYPDI